MSEPPATAGPFAWDQIAAELAAAEAADEHDGRPGHGRRPATEEDWDDVAARLASSLARPATRGPAGPAGEPPGVPGPTAGDPTEGDPVVAAAAPAAAAPVPDALPTAASAAPDADAQRDDGAAAAAEVEVVDPLELRGGLEALLFVVDTPVDEGTLAATLRCPVPVLRRALAELGADYDARRAGVVLRRVGEGWRLYTREDHAAVVERYLLEGQRGRLTQAALETLAVIAYRQPVTRGQVSAVRGVGVDAVVRTLVSRGLVYECGTDPDSGGGLYATTPLFLERLGLTGLDELPELAPLLPEAQTVLDEHPES